MITKKYLTFYQSIFESLIELLRLIKMDPVQYFVNEILRPILMPAYGLGMMFGFYLIYAYKMDWNETLLDFLSSLGFGIALFVCSLKWRQFFETFYRLPGFYGLLGMMFGTSFTYAYKMDQNWIVETLLDFFSALGLGFIFGTALKMRMRIIQMIQRMRMIQMIQMRIRMIQTQNPEKRKTKLRTQKRERRIIRPMLMTGMMKEERWTT